VVIASAGISVGMDTAVRADLDVMRDTFATNNLGLAATFHPFVAAMRQRGSGSLVGIASVVGDPRPARPRRLLRQQGRGGVVLREPARRVPRRRRAGRDAAAGLHCHAADRGQPLPHALHAAAEAFAERAFRAIERGSSYAVIPWQMAVVAKLLRLLPNAVFDSLLARRRRKPPTPVNGTPETRRHNDKSALAEAARFRCSG
jgi:NAD(P)-dependent dehydrogenase (short-subunit alcohol dehydrogenase family)